MTSPSSHDFHPSSLREYDIRGIIGETLGADDAYAIGRGFGTLIARDSDALLCRICPKTGPGRHNDYRQPQSRKL